MDDWLTKLLDALLRWLGRVPAQRRVDESKQNVNHARAVHKRTKTEFAAAKAKASIAGGESGGFRRRDGLRVSPALVANRRRNPSQRSQDVLRSHAPSTNTSCGR